MKKKKVKPPFCKCIQSYCSVWTTVQSYCPVWTTVQSYCPVWTTVQSTRLVSCNNVAWKDPCSGFITISTQDLVELTELTAM